MAMAGFVGATVLLRAGRREHVVHGHVADGVRIVHIATELGVGISTSGSHLVAVLIQNGGAAHTADLLVL